MANLPALTVDQLIEQRTELLGDIHLALATIEAAVEEFRPLLAAA